MIMMGLEFTGQPPFHTVYLHGLIRDDRGRKMSKTLGNFIDPLVLMDEFGTDALRFYLLTSSTPGNDINVSPERVEANRNFANKLWNAARLVLSAVERVEEKPSTVPAPTLADDWVRARQAGMLREVARLFESFQFGEAGRQIHEFFWGEFADWYLEIAKLQLDESPARAWATAAVMVEILDRCLRLLHPFTPFVTEELWGRLKAACEARPGLGPEAGWDEALIVARWPEAPRPRPDEAGPLASFGKVMEVVRTIRNARSEKAVDPHRRIPAVIRAGSDAGLLDSQRSLLVHLARLDPQALTIAAHAPAPTESMPIVVGSIEIFLPLAGMVDAAAETKRLAGEMRAVEAQIERLEKLLAGPFAQRAPAEVVQKERDKLAELEASRERLETARKALS
jgi:valyl-tRNA synthetase